MGPTDEPLSGAPADPSTPLTPAADPVARSVEAEIKSEEEPVVAVPPTAPQPVAASEPPAPAEPMAPAQDPAIASTMSIPATDPGEGGEWDLLTEKLRDWMANNQLNELWDKTKTPAKLIGILILVIVVLQIYSGILNTIAQLPLAPRLLELAGLIWVARFAFQNLIRSSDRKQALGGLRTLWSKVIGG